MGPSVLFKMDVGEFRLFFIIILANRGCASIVTQQSLKISTGGSKKQKNKNKTRQKKTCVPESIESLLHWDKTSDSCQLLQSLYLPGSIQTGLSIVKSSLLVLLVL